MPPRRNLTPASPAPPAPNPPPPRDPALLARDDPEWAANLRRLRQNWKWASFCQFFHTFAPLLAAPDVFIGDVEDDLARGTNVYLPRIMQRLLVTLSQDRKITLDNWQSALRRQYNRRDPGANPIGPEPKAPSRAESEEPSETEENVEMKVETQAEEQAEPPAKEEGASTPQGAVPETEGAAQADQQLPELPPSEAKAEQQDPSLPHAEPEPEPEPEQSKDWLELPMLERLDSLHTLQEWQFQNPNRVRQQMKDDDDTAQWRIEPIGYDAKTNAYWLIGTDRLWIQRVPPKPPKTLKRKRPTAPKPKARAQKQPSPSPSSSDESPDEASLPAKRTRRQTRTNTSTTTRGRPQRTAASRKRTRRASPSPSPSASSSPNGKRARAAKLYANQKLDAQAKELMSFQRQASAMDKAKSRANGSPSKRGTRLSARLRGAGGDEEDEWQQVPDEWLAEESAPGRRRSARGRVRKPVVKPRRDEDEGSGEEDEDEGEQEEEAEKEDEKEDKPAVAPDDQPDAERKEEPAADGEAEKKDDDETEKKDEEAGDAKGEEAAVLQRAGLESDEISELTDLSDAEGAGEEEDDPPEPRSKARRGRPRRAAAAAPATTRRQNGKRKAPADEEETDAAPAEEPPAAGEEPPLPADFIEWEAICVTLSEWEHVAERFEKATHYLEKALYKVLSQHIVPEVTEALRETEKRRRLEEAIVHRKRSSRIALKEVEKEEARVSAKKKAEEDDKLARTRRQEARLKKEETERAKREREREQRRQEREEKEARARKRAERGGSRDGDMMTPSASTPGASSVQSTRVQTPNGVRTPDWILDCEICKKSGLNIDDGLPMVSCGSCKRWQHITCHDVADQRAGRPRRHWQKQMFYCTRCQMRAMQSHSHASHSQHTFTASQQYGLTHPHALPQQKSYNYVPYRLDPRSSHPSLSNGLGYAQQYSAAQSFNRTQPMDNPLTFSHYQPDQRAFAKPSNMHQVPTWDSSGYSQVDPMTARNGGMQQRPQYTHGLGNFGGVMQGGLTSSSPTTPSYTAQDPLLSMAGRWPGSSSGSFNGTNPALQAAAESLAFMQGSGRAQTGAWPQQQHAFATDQFPSAQQQQQRMVPQQPAYTHTPVSFDPLLIPSAASGHHQHQSVPGATNGFHFAS